MTLLCVTLALSIFIVLPGLCSPARAPKSPKQPTRSWRVSNAVEFTEAVRKMPPDGGQIILEPGTYHIRDTIKFTGKSNVSIAGSGWSTVIKKNGPGDAIVFSGSDWCCAVRNLTIEGDPGAKSGSGIVFRDGEWSGICVIDYCHIKGFPESGIRFEGNAQKPFSSNTVSNCWLTNNSGDQLASINNNDFYFWGNQFGAGADRTPRSGALLQGSSAGTYSMNYHWGNQVALRVKDKSNFNRIENNRFEQSRESGILIGTPSSLEDCRLGIIIGNTIHTNSEHNSGKFSAVAAYGASDITFTSNQIFSWDSNSVKCSSALVLGSGCRTWIVKDNILRHCTAQPIVCDQAAGHIVKDNIMD